MFSEKLQEQLNEQIKYELFSSQLYLAMAAYCADQDLDGFTNFFKVQAEEEKFHAMKFFDFINEMGGRVVITGFENPEIHYASVLDVFEKSLAHEKHVTKRIYSLMDLAMDEREHATISFLRWFIDEQVEEEAMFQGVIKKLKMIGQDVNAMYLLDNEMAQRTWVAPTE
ncbi:ferritin [Heliorestis acidaminivorans]|uniref:Ferritin n=1 Tax=Heliorestis acidaminivorans TaxID=553427 RepID=A0A6I0F2J1_9FIRM|nr:ferritin [Heliorestis acidaminivorans]KAB2953633.1 ferritin [Heliorestis acidaminivorans]